MNLRPFLILLFACTLLPMMAQEPKDDDYTRTEATQPAMRYYMEVISVQKGVSHNADVSYDFGKLLPQALGVREADLKQIYSTIKFNNPIDAINFFAAKGWELTQTYSNSVGNLTTTHYILTIVSSDSKALLQAMMKR